MAEKQVATTLIIFSLLVGANLYADPFGGGGLADPFGGKRIPEKIRRENQIRMLMHRGGTVARNMQKSESDPVFFEGAMSRIEYGGNDVEGFIDSVSKLASRQWNLKDGETAKQLLVRLGEEFETSPGRYAVQFRSMRREYKKIAAKSWPYEWRNREKLWSQLFETIIASRDAENPATPWAKRIADDPKYSNLYSLGYLGVVRSGIVKAKQLDHEFLAKILKKRTGPEPSNITWQARVFQAYAVAGIPPTDETRAALRTQLVKNIEAGQIKISNEDTIRAIGKVCNICEPMIEADPILAALLNNSPTRAYQVASSMAGKQDNETFKHLLRKETSVEYKGVPLGAAIQDMRQKINLPIWIDDEIKEYSKTTNVSVDGSWQEVMVAILKETPFRFEQVNQEAIYIVGTPEKIKVANGMTEAGLAKIGKRHRRVADSLRQPSRAEFIGTSFSDVCEYLSDRHGVSINLLGDLGRKPITLQMTGPMHLIMTRMALTLEADWTISDEQIVVGAKKEIAAFQILDGLRAARIARLHKAKSKIGSALEDETRMEFIETPLNDVAEYLEDLHGVPFFVLSSAAKSHISMDIRGASLAWALDLLTHRTALTWDAEPGFIFIGKEEQVRKLQKLGTSRADRRKKYPMDLVKKLTLPPDESVAYVDIRLSQFSKLLTARTGVQFTLSNEDLRGQLITCAYEKLPLDEMLDILTVNNGLSWQLLNGAVHLDKQVDEPQKE